MKIKDRIDIMEIKLDKHLEDAPRVWENLKEQHNDIKWIKKIGYFLVSAPFITEALRHIWK